MRATQQMRGDSISWDDPSVFALPGNVCDGLGRKPSLAFWVLSRSLFYGSSTSKRCGAKSRRYFRCPQCGRRGVAVSSPSSVRDLQLLRLRGQMGGLQFSDQSQDQVACQTRRGLFGAWYPRNESDQKLPQMPALTASAIVPGNIATGAEEPVVVPRTAPLAS